MAKQNLRVTFKSIVDYATWLTYWPRNLILLRNLIVWLIRKYGEAKFTSNIQVYCWLRNLIDLLTAQLDPITQLNCMINKKINTLFTVYVGPYRKLFPLGLKSVPRLAASGRFWDLGKIFF